MGRLKFLSKKDKLRLSNEQTWQLCERHALFSDTNPQLLVNPPADFQLRSHQYAWCIYAHQQAVLQRESTARVELDAFYRPAREFSQVIVFLPKEKPLLRFLLAQLNAHLPLGTEVVIVGAKDTGIKSIAKIPLRGFSPVVKGPSGNHCQLLFTQTTERHHFEPSLAFSQRDELYFLPGVFSFEKKDLGTQFLLEHLPATISGSVLDLGCGCGIISQWLSLQRSPSEITATDLSALAIAVSKKTLEHCRIPVHFCLSDGFHQLSGRYDWIISNPPFHQGKQNDYAITERFIANAKDHLQPHGRIILVYNRFLPWHQKLSEQFATVELLAENSRYAVSLAR